MHNMAVSKCCATDEFCNRALVHSAEFNFSCYNFETNLVLWMCPAMCLFCLRCIRWLWNIFLLLFEIISYGWTAVTVDCIDILLCLVSPVSKMSWRCQRCLANVHNVREYVYSLWKCIRGISCTAVLWDFGILNNIIYKFYL